jgi:hypothetical protein
LGSDHSTVRDPSEDELYDRFRPSGDRYRVEGCNDGIEDTIVTGEVSFTTLPGETLFLTIEPLFSSPMNDIVSHGVIACITEE